MTPELLSKIAIWRQKAINQELTMEEMNERLSVEELNKQTEWYLAEAARLTRQSKVLIWIAGVIAFASLMIVIARRVGWLE